MGNINLSEWLSVADDIAIKISDLQKENADLKCKVTQLGIGNDELVIRISDLQGENEKLLDRIDELHEGALDHKEKRLTVMEENAELEEINAELEVVVKVLGNIIKGMKCNNCECNNDRIGCLEEELDAKRLQITDFLKEQMTTALEIINLKQQVENLKAEVASACNDLLDSHQREIATANEKLKVEEELSTLKNSVITIGTVPNESNS